MFFYQFRSYFCFRNIFLSSFLSLFSSFHRFFIFFFLSLFLFVSKRGWLMAFSFFFFFSIIFLFVSSHFFLRLGYRLYWSSKEGKQRRFFKKRCNIMVRECENFFLNRSFVLPRNEGNEICLFYSKNIDSSTCLFVKIQIFLFFFLNSVGCDALFLLFSFSLVLSPSLVCYIESLAQRLEKNQDRCNNFNGTQ